MAKTSTKLVGGVLALAVATVIAHEGLRLNAYRDIVGVPTVCFGETRGVNMGDSYTREQCESMLEVRLREFAAGVDACLQNERQIPARTYVSFVSFAYNIGIAGFCGSTTKKLANAGDLRGACNAMLRWNRAGGKVIKGLQRRREEERALCLEGLQ